MLLRHVVLTHWRLANIYRYLVMADNNVAQPSAENVLRFVGFVSVSLFVVVVVLDKTSHDAQQELKLKAI